MFFIIITSGTHDYVQKRSRVYGTYEFRSIGRKTEVKQYS